MKNIIQSIIIGISIAAIPGPIFFELVRRTLTKGFWNGALLSIGEFLGNFILLFLIFFGLKPFLSHPTFQMLLYVLGSTILIWLGTIAFKLKKENIEKSYLDANKTNNSIVVGFGIAISSPIVIALWISLSGSYLAELASPFLAFVNIFFIAFGFIIFFFSLAAIIHYTRHKIPSKYIILLSKIFGFVLLYYGGSFLYKFLILFTTIN